MEIDEKFYRTVYSLDKSVDINEHWLFIGKKNGYFPNVKEFYKKFYNFECVDKKKELAKIKHWIQNNLTDLVSQPYYDKIFFEHITNIDWDTIKNSYDINLVNNIIYVDYDKTNNQHNDLINKLKIKIKKETKYIVKKITQDEDISLCKYFINFKERIDPDYLVYSYTNNIIVLSQGESNKNSNDYILYFKTIEGLNKIIDILESNKTFDIIIPCYNTEKYIEKSIKSVFAQTYKKFNLYIIDDKSTDNTSQILKKYESVSNITIITNKNNMGKFESINAMTEKLKSDYYLILDSDDILIKNRLLFDLITFVKKDKILGVQSRYYRYNEITNKIVQEPIYGENIITFDRKIFDHIGKYFHTRFGGDTEYVERIIKFLGTNSIYQLNKITYIAIHRKDESNLTKTVDMKKRLKFVSKYRKLHELNSVNFFIELFK